VIEQPSKQTIHALAALQGNTDFQVVIDWLRNTLHKLQEDGAYTKDETQSRWNQGAQQLLQEFLLKSEKARETAYTIRS
jgi:hypothetical protein